MVARRAVLPKLVPHSPVQLDLGPAAGLQVARFMVCWMPSAWSAPLLGHQLVREVARGRFYATPLGRVVASSVPVYLRRILLVEGLRELGRTGFGVR